MTKSIPFTKASLLRDEISAALILYIAEVKLFWQNSLSEQLCFEAVRMGGVAAATRAEPAHIRCNDSEYAIVVLAKGDIGVGEADGDFVVVGSDSQAMAVELVVEVASAWEMPSQTPVDNQPNVLNPFAPLQQLVLRINSESRAQEVIDKARDLNVEERQLLVDVLNMTLDKSKILSQRYAHAWSALIKIMSSARIFAQNWTVRSEYMATSSEAPAHVKVVRQTQDCMSAILSEKLVEWAHLSHPNILPLYASFFESEDHPSFVSPSESTVKICDHTRSLTSDQRLPLILDVINGLYHLHQLNTIHGGLSPGTVLVSDKGRALITNLDVLSEEEDSNALLARYSAPELSLEDDSRPMKATDVWVFSCLAIKSSITNLELAKAVLLQILGSHEPASPQVPKYLHDTLSWLIRNSKALDTTKVAAKKLNCDNTQTLVDLIELVVKDLPYLPKSNFIGQLLYDIMHSTHIFPQYYRASSVQYDPTRLVSEYRKGKLYEGHVLKICVCIVNSNVTSNIIHDLALWANTSHPNILPFHGVFHESLTEPPQFCVVLPHLKNGTLEDCTSTLPQKSRMLLISNVASGLAYLWNVMGYKSEYILIMLPYYQVPDEQVQDQVFFGNEPLIWPDRTDAEMDEIDDEAWELITKCCAYNPKDEPDLSQIQEMLANMEIEEDHRPPAMPLPIPKVQVLRSRPEVDLDRTEIALNQVQAS
ncbi:hypothetical protein AN958_12021 [Leucoagaricus sp. SymC.cos]|nr:hypothetical protein AN958_12021 [Leucoagaricus sp. SymC.cos]